MKLFTPRSFFRSFGIAILSYISTASAQYSAGQNANYVWGQSDFVTGTSGLTQSRFSSPAAIAVDPQTGKFFMADTANSRVLRFASAAAYTNGAAAEAVFGQQDFYANVTGNAADEMNIPWGVAVDASGNLWVSDSGNNRVLKFTGAATAASSASASVVLGQQVFGASTPAAGQSGMNQPAGITIDSAGSLYVADYINNRVLKFANASSLTTAALATNVFGQTNYLSTDPGTTASTLNTPFGVTVDSSGTLWVADLGNHRVLGFASSVTSSDGPNASIVLGQADFTSGAPGTTATTMKFPSLLCTDSFGRLYVSDNGNNRVLVFETPHAASGAAATFVLGQTNFTSATAGTTQSTMNSPRGVAFTQNTLFVTEEGNNRMMNYAITGGTPAFSAPASVKLNAKQKKKIIAVYLLNTGGDDILTAGVALTGQTKSLASIAITDYTGANVTSQLLAGSYTTSLFGPNSGVSALPFSVKISPKTKAAKKGGTIQLTFSATAKTSGSSTSQVIKGKYKKPKKSKK